MKAVIVDLKDSNAVILRDDGRFEKIKNKNYSIGQEITLQSQMLHFPKQAVVAASAALAITACGGLGTYTWSNPISYVSLDINPSIAYSLNEFNRVIAVNGMNEEGSAIVDAIGDSLKNADITTALTITVEQLSNDAYIDAENTNYMIIGVYSDKEKKASDLMSTVDAFSASAVDTCSITTVNVSKETKETADAYGITAGKMELINEITDVAADPQEIDPAALADLSVAQLEETKAAAATGASVSSAVASAVPDSPDESKESDKSADAAPASVENDPNAVVSDSKPEEAVDSSSAKKDAVSETKDASADQTTDNSSPTQTTQVTSSNSDSTTPASGSMSDNTSSATNTTNSTDTNGNGSSVKKDDTTDNNKKDNTADASSSKGETVSSEKKDDTSSSSKKDDAASSEKKDDKKDNKKDEITEDDSSQTNTAPPESIPDTDIDDDPSTWIIDPFHEGNMLS